MNKSINKLSKELHSKFNIGWIRLYNEYLNKKDENLDNAILYCYNNLIVLKKSIDECLNKLTNG